MIIGVLLWFYYVVGDFRLFLVFVGMSCCFLWVLMYFYSSWWFLWCVFVVLGGLWWFIVFFGVS